ncbi:LacI family DNA-binding transcriptional regulator [Nakamurella endophytica]|uniref:Alanine racemase n=1 Tax=Nakamurella endophytica TaxID=1748367 RepID=A0A917SUV3_9ACTN|nr:LacI family DNA-binding transcriptional regulator [Nakamurella endophytica]GGL98855.1 alanine racemase [Nakamurella endophytica]
MTRATARSVAEAAGVSRTAVSFAFNDPAKISADTRRRILAEAERLGYSPHPVARALNRGTTDALGLLLPQPIPEVLENPYYNLFLQGVGQVCQREGLTLLLTPPLRGSMLTAIPYAAVDGFIVSGLEVDRGEVAALQRRHVPFVLVDSDAPEGVPSVEVTDRQGMADVVQHVLELGHRRIALLSFEAGPDRATGYRGPLARRLAGADEALRRVGLSLSAPGIDLVEVPCTRGAGYDAVAALLARADRPTAIVTFSDILALGALDAARDAGIDVPGELSVTGYDDQPDASYARPQLTTVRQSIEAKGRVAADFLVSAITGDAHHPHQVLHTTLIVRGSTGPAPDDRIPAG